MKRLSRLSYFAGGVVAPFAFGLFLAVAPLLIRTAGLSGGVALICFFLVSIGLLVVLIYLQRRLRIWAQLEFTVPIRILIYALAFAWWSLVVIALGTNIAALATINSEKSALVSIIRSCWITSRLEGIKEPTFGDLSRVAQGNGDWLRKRRSFYELRDPKTNAIIYEEKAKESSCFDVYSSPISMASGFSPILRATLPDVTDESASKFQNFTESIILNGKNLRARPWNRIKPDVQNIYRTCRTKTGIGCNQELNNTGRAW